MSEQQQAQALADWLAQPHDSPPPTGLDADVLESVYALQPERAPAPTLAAADVMADFDAIMGKSVSEQAPQPVTTVSAAPTWWRSANRVGGFGVLVAIAATLLLVALPTMQRDAPMLEAAPASAPSAKDSERAVAQAPAAPAQEAKPAAEKAKPPAKSLKKTVASANEAVPMGAPQAGDSVIPEVAASLSNDAVAVADVAEPELADASADADAMAAPQAAAAPAPDPVSQRGAAWPNDLSESWRSVADATTVQAMNQALSIADTEAGAGRYSLAADAMRGMVSPPASAGQYAAAKAASWYLQAGDLEAASSTAQSGLALSQDNTPTRSWLLVLLGDVRAAQGDSSGAEASYRQAQQLNSAR